MYACMYACMHVCMYAYMHACMLVICMYVCTSCTCILHRSTSISGPHSCSYSRSSDWSGFSRSSDCCCEGTRLPCRVLVPMQLAHTASSSALNRCIWWWHHAKVHLVETDLGIRCRSEFLGSSLAHFVLFLLVRVYLSCTHSLIPLLLLTRWQQLAWVPQ